MVIHCSDMTRIAGDDIRLNNVSVTITENTFCSIIGDTGAGKTTLLRVINGELAPSTGTISVFGNPPHRVKHRIAVLDERRLGFSCLTGSDYMKMYQDIYQNWNRERFEAVREHSNLIMEKKLSKYTAEQRTVLFFALLAASGADLLLLDEPFRHIPATFRVRLLITLRQLVDETNCTVVCASHEDNGLGDFTDTLITMKHGKIILAGILGTLRQEHRIVETCPEAFDYTRIGPVISRTLCRTRDIDGDTPTMKELAAGYINRRPS